MNRTRSRRGYAMMLVLVFLGLVFSFVSLSGRYFATTLRFQKARVEAEQSRNEGSARALAAGLALLETGHPSVSPDPYSIRISASDENSSYTVTFSSADVESGVWSVEARPTMPLEDPPAMPDAFPPAPEEPSEPPPASPV